MRILPQLEHKKFEDCALGELMRLPHGKHPLGIKASFDDGAPAAVLFELRDNGIVAPCYVPWPSNGTHVLSYGSNYEIEIDHLNEYELRSKELYERSGSISLMRGRTFMCVQPRSGTSFYWTGYLDLTSATISAPDFEANAATFARWKLQIPHPHNLPSQVIFEFSIV